MNNENNYVEINRQSRPDRADLQSVPRSRANLSRGLNIIKQKNRHHRFFYVFLSRDSR